MPEMQARFTEALQSVLGARTHFDIETAPDWLRRPGVDEMGVAWPLVSDVYSELTGLELPEIAPLREHRRLDAIVTMAGVPRVVEFDENQHFTAPRLQTLAHYGEGATVAFDVGYWRGGCVARAGKEPGGGFAAPKPPLFPGTGGRHRQRAFRDFLADMIPAQYGRLPTVRFEIVEVTRALSSDNVTSAIGKLWESRA